jgi:flagellar biosynthesis protein FliP
MKTVRQSAVRSPQSVGQKRSLRRDTSRTLSKLDREQCDRSGHGLRTTDEPQRRRALPKGYGHLLTLLALMIVPSLANAAGIPAVTVTTNPNGGQEYSLTLQILLLMTAVTLLPGIVLMMTAFTRIVIVLAILRQALGAGQAPPNQVLIGLSLFLTLFVMGPVIDKINVDSVQPYMAGTIDATTAMTRGAEPLKRFMLDQTRESDIATFVRISGGEGFQKPEDVPLRILVPAFATSELKSAFQIGFLIFIPFVIIDLVVASVLMSMGMMMLSPVLISLPFKLMLFVLVDGWGLIMGTLAASFYT